MSHRAWMSFLGLLSILAGLVLLIYPGLSLVALAVIVAGASACGLDPGR